jgi:hypothetical protein
MLKMKSILIIFIITFSLSNYAQTFMLNNKNESIRLSILNDSLSFELKNESENSFFIPVFNSLTQNCSINGDMLTIDFGIGLDDFYERAIYELEEIQPKNSKIITTKLIKCNFDSIIKFSFQFYIRKMPPNDSAKPIFNTDFIYDKFLLKGDWEWGEMYIDQKSKSK